MLAICGLHPAGMSQLSCLGVTLALLLSMTLKLQCSFPAGRYHALTNYFPVCACLPEDLLLSHFLPEISSPLTSMCQFKRKVKKMAFPKLLGENWIASSLLLCGFVSVTRWRCTCKDIQEQQGCGGTGFRPGLQALGGQLGCWVILIVTHHPFIPLVTWAKWGIETPSHATLLTSFCCGVISQDQHLTHHA